MDGDVFEKLMTGEMVYDADAELARYQEELEKKKEEAKKEENSDSDAE